MDFKDFSYDCVWRTNQGHTYHTVAVEDNEMVSKESRGRVMDNTHFCGALGIKCEKKICAPFHFIQTYHILQEQEAEKFLGELD